MKLLEKERIEVATPTPTPTPTRVVAPRPVATPTIRVRARVVSRPAPKRSRGAELVVARTVMFCAIMGLTYVSSTLGGYVMLERARQLGRHGAERAAYARVEATSARESIEALTNPAALGAWAKAHGFVPGGAPAEAPTDGEARVAVR